MESRDGEAERYRRLHEAFGACRGLDESARRQRIDALRSEDAALAEELERLLGSTAREGDALADEVIDARQGVGDWLGAAAPQAEMERERPDTIGPYRVIRELGAGGMGVVYEAEQERPRRRVAIKVLQPGLAFGERVRRFRLEGELLARLQHPGIAQVFEVASADLGHGEQPYLVMELVQGQPLHVHADREQLDRRARLVLVAELCDAVQHAHDRGVVHRDLKPDNVLVDASGRAKVLDFGVARLRADDAPLTTIHTSEGQIVGTLTHMAPEQLTGNVAATGPRADVYALGVIAFELLTGRLPHEIAGLPITQAVRQVSEQMAPRLGSLDRGLRGDVETIVGKALEHEPARRYVSAAALGSDLRRFLAHRPISARPPSLPYRARRFARRQPWMVAAALSLLAGAVLSILFAVSARRDRAEAERQTYRSALAAAIAAHADGEDEVTRRRLETAPAALRGWEWRALAARSAPTWRPLGEPVLGGVQATAVANDLPLVAVAPRMTEVQPSGPGGTPKTTLSINDADQRRRVEEIDLPLLVVFYIAFRPGDRELVLGAVREDWHDDISLFVYRRDTRELEFWRQLGASVAELSPCGAHVGWRDPVSGTVRIEESESGRLIGETRGSFPSMGAAFASAYADPDSLVFDLSSDTEPIRWAGRILALAPDRPRFLGRSPAGSFEVWDFLPELDRVAKLPGAALSGNSFSRGGERVVSLEQTHTARVYDLEEQVFLGPFQGDLREGDPDPDDPSAGRLRLPPRLLPDGERLVTIATGEETLRVWPVRADTHRLRAHESFVYGAAFLEGSLLDSGLLVTAGWDGYAGRPGAVRLWDVASGVEIARFGSSAVAADSIAVVPGTSDFVVGLFNPHDETGSMRPIAIQRRGPDGALRWSVEGSNRNRLALAPDATELAMTVSDGTLHWLDLETGKGLGQRENAWASDAFNYYYPVAWSPVGDRVAVATGGVSIELFAAEDHRSLGTWVAHRGDVGDLAFSADGRWLASASEDGSVGLWDVSTGAPLGLLPHGASALSVAFHPTEPRLVCGTREGMVHVWGVEQGEHCVELLRMPMHQSYIKHLEWSPDGEALVTCSGDSTVGLWDTTTVVERLAARDARRELVARLEPRLGELLAGAESDEEVRKLLERSELRADERRVVYQLFLARAWAALR